MFRAALLLLLLIAPVGAQVCSQRIWKHVYHPKRLDRQKCITVRGRVLSTVGERDGDRHIRMQLDSGGPMLVEVICATAPKVLAAEEACKGHTNKLPLPAKGTHISVTGWRVFDIDHKWLEIHPATRLRILKH